MGREISWPSQIVSAKMTGTLLCTRANGTCVILTKTFLHEAFLSCVVVTVSLCHVTRQKMTDKGEEEEKERNADMKRGGKASRQRKRKGGGKKFSFRVAFLYGEDEDKNFISESRLHLRTVYPMYGTGCAF